MPGKFHGWKSLVGYSPWGRKGSDMTERLTLDGLCSVFGGTPYVPKNELLVLPALDFQELMENASFHMTLGYSHFQLLSSFVNEERLWYLPQ